MQRQIIGTTVTFAFLALTLCGAGLLMVQDMNDHGVCPFSSAVSQCIIDAGSHLARLLALLGPAPLLVVLMTLMVAVLAPAARELSLRNRSPWRQKRTPDTQAPLLLLAFSDGLLNPKLF